MKELYFTEKDLASRYEELCSMSWRLIEEESVDFKKWMAERYIEQKFAESLGAEKYERTEGRKGDRGGHYLRNLQLKTCRLKRLMIPRSTGHKWQNPLIEKFQRKSYEFESMVYYGFLYGHSCKDARKYLKEFHGEDVLSEQGVSDIFKKFSKEVDSWHKREISGKYRFIFWDGKYVKVRGSTKKKKAVLKVMGIRFDGRCEIIDFRVARSEAHLHWSGLAQSLYNRGLRCEETELFIIDGASGLEETLNLIWPDIKRQNCKVHHIRNLAKRSKRINKGKISKEAAKIYKARTKEQAELRAVKFEAKWKIKEPKAVRIFMKGLEPTLTFYDFGWDKEYTKEDRQALWQVISNTNYLERNIEEDVRRIKPMRCFRNNDSCDRVFYAKALEFNKNPWRFDLLAQKSQKRKSAEILT